MPRDLTKTQLTVPVRSTLATCVSSEVIPLHVPGMRQVALSVLTLQTRNGGRDRPAEDSRYWCPHRPHFEPSCPPTPSSSTPRQKSASYCVSGTGIFSPA